jgi:uncharacterized protein (UPF0333 family)
MERKGQTALEYLLIVVVALIIVVSVMIFMSGTKSDAGGAGTKATYEIFYENGVMLLPLAFGSKLFSKKE